MRVSNQDSRWLVMTYNENLFASQWATVQNDLAQALGQLAEVRENLKNRADGRIKGASNRQQHPTVTLASVLKENDPLLGDV